MSTFAALLALQNDAKQQSITRDAVGTLQRDLSTKLITLETPLLQALDSELLLNQSLWYIISTQQSSNHELPTTFYQDISKTAFEFAKPFAYHTELDYIALLAQIRSHPREFAKILFKWDLTTQPGYTFPTNPPPADAAAPKTLHKPAIPIQITLPNGLTMENFKSTFSFTVLKDIYGLSDDVNSSDLESITPLTKASQLFPLQSMSLFLLHYIDVAYEHFLSPSSNNSNTTNSPTSNPSQSFSPNDTHSQVHAPTSFTNYLLKPTGMFAKLIRQFIQISSKTPLSHSILPIISWLVSNEHLDISGDWASLLSAFTQLLNTTALKHSQHSDPTLSPDLTGGIPLPHAPSHSPLSIQYMNAFSTFCFLGNLTLSQSGSLPQLAVNFISSLASLFATIPESVHVVLAKIVELDQKAAQNYPTAPKTVTTNSNNHTNPASALIATEPSSAMTTANANTNASRGPFGTSLQGLQQLTTQAKQLQLQQAQSQQSDRQKLQTLFSPQLWSRFLPILSVSELSTTLPSILQPNFLDEGEDADESDLQHAKIKQTHNPYLNFDVLTHLFDPITEPHSATNPLKPTSTTALLSLLFSVIIQPLIHTPELFNLVTSTPITAISRRNLLIVASYIQLMFKSMDLLGDLSTRSEAITNASSTSDSVNTGEKNEVVVIEKGSTDNDDLKHARLSELQKTTVSNPFFSVILTFIQQSLEGYIASSLRTLSAGAMNAANSSSPLHSPGTPNTQPLLSFMKSPHIVGVSLSHFLLAMDQIYPNVKQICDRINRYVGFCDQLRDSWGYCDSTPSTLSTSLRIEITAAQIAHNSSASGDEPKATKSQQQRGKNTKAKKGETVAEIVENDKSVEKGENTENPALESPLTQPARTRTPPEIAITAIPLNILYALHAMLLGHYQFTPPESPIDPIYSVTQRLSTTLPVLQGLNSNGNRYLLLKVATPRIDSIISDADAQMDAKINAFWSETTHIIAEFIKTEVEKQKSGETLFIDFSKINAEDYIPCISPVKQIITALLHILSSLPPLDLFISPHSFSASLDHLSDPDQQNPQMSIVAIILHLFQHFGHLQNTQSAVSILESISPLFHALPPLFHYNNYALLSHILEAYQQASSASGATSTRTTQPSETYETALKTISILFTTCINHYIPALFSRLRTRSQSVAQSFFKFQIRKHLATHYGSIISFHTFLTKEIQQNLNLYNGYPRVFHRYICSLLPPSYEFVYKAMINPESTNPLLQPNRSAQYQPYQNNSTPMTLNQPLQLPLSLPQIQPISLSDPTLLPVHQHYDVIVKQLVSSSANNLSKLCFADLHKTSTNSFLTLPLHGITTMLHPSCNGRYPVDLANSIYSCQDCVSKMSHKQKIVKSFISKYFSDKLLTIPQVAPSTTANPKRIIELNEIAGYGGGFGIQGVAGILPPFSLDPTQSSASPPISASFSSNSFPITPQQSYVHVLDYILSHTTLKLFAICPTADNRWSLDISFLLSVFPTFASWYSYISQPTSDALDQALVLPLLINYITSVLDAYAQEYIYTPQPQIQQQHQQQTPTVQTTQLTSTPSQSSVNQDQVPPTPSVKVISMEEDPLAALAQQHNAKIHGTGPISSIPGPSPTPSTPVLPSTTLSTPSVPNITSNPSTPKVVSSLAQTALDPNSAFNTPLTSPLAANAQSANTFNQQPIQPPVDHQAQLNSWIAQIVQKLQQIVPDVSSTNPLRSTTSASSTTSPSNHGFNVNQLAPLQILPNTPYVGRATITEAIVQLERAMTASSLTAKLSAMESMRNIISTALSNPSLSKLPYDLPTAIDGQYYAEYHAAVDILKRQQDRQTAEPQPDLKDRVKGDIIKDSGKSKSKSKAKTKPEEEQDDDDVKMGDIPESPALPSQQLHQIVIPSANVNPWAGVENAMSSSPKSSILPLHSHTLFHRSQINTLSPAPLDAPPSASNITPGTPNLTPSSSFTQSYSSLGSSTLSQSPLHQLPFQFANLYDFGYINHDRSPHIHTVTTFQQNQHSYILPHTPQLNHSRFFDKHTKLPHVFPRYPSLQHYSYQLPHLQHSPKLLPLFNSSSYPYNASATANPTTILSPALMNSTTGGNLNQSQNSSLNLSLSVAPSLKAQFLLYNSSTPASTDDTDNSLDYPLPSVQLLSQFPDHFANAILPFFPFAEHSVKQQYPEPLFSPFSMQISQTQTQTQTAPYQFRNKASGNSADDFIFLFCYLLLVAQPRHLPSTLTYIKMLYFNLYPSATPSSTASPTTPTPLEQQYKSYLDICLVFRAIQNVSDRLRHNMKTLYNDIIPADLQTFAKAHFTPKQPPQSAANIPANRPPNRIEQTKLNIVTQMVLEGYYAAEDISVIVDTLQAQTLFDADYKGIISHKLRAQKPTY